MAVLYVEVLPEPAEAQHYAFWFDGSESALVRGDLETSRIDTLFTPRRPTAFDVSGGTLYWADWHTKTIRRGPPDTPESDVLVSGTGYVTHLAIDVAGETVYWFEWAQRYFPFEPGRIRRANLDGSGVLDVLDEISITSFRIDPDAGYLYWSDRTSIRRAALDGSEVQEVVTGGQNILDFVVHQADGRVYWTDNSERAVFRASLDGGMRETVVDEVYAFSLAFDAESEQLYYGTEGEIHRISSDGTSTPVLTDLPPFVLRISSIVLGDAAGLLYWMESEHITVGRIMRVETGSGEIEEIASGLNAPSGMAAEPVDEHVYLLGRGGEMVRAEWDGSDARTVLHGYCGIGWVEGLALDPQERKLYWGLQSDCFGYARADLDGTNLEVVAPSPYRPSSLAVDYVGGRLYWSGYSEQLQRVAVLRAVLGSREFGDVDLLLENFDHPPRIKLDLVAGKIYWIESNVIRRSNLDGTGIEDVLEGLDDPHSIALDVAGGHMYWIERGAIRRGNLDGSGVEDVLTGLSSPSGLALSFENSGVVTSTPAVEVPLTMALQQNYPNPFNPSTRIPFTLPEPAYVTVTVFDLLGQELAVLVSGDLPAGEHTATFNATTVATGVYLYRLTTGSFTETRRMMVVR